jgi:hypothetical protein
MSGTTAKRIVVCTRDRAVLAACGSAAHAQGPLEAAAEVLAQPADAMVLDGRLLTMRDAGLLRVAGRCAASVLVVYADACRLDIDPEDRLSLGDLPSALARVPKFEAPAGAEPAPPRPDESASIEPAPQRPAEPTGAAPPAAGVKTLHSQRLLTDEELSALLGPIK